jgi:Na+/melibiose symporter-like transporter
MKEKLRTIRKVKRIVGTIGVIAFVLAFGCVGGVEHGTFPLIAGVFCMAVCVCVVGVCVFINTYLDQEKARFLRLYSIKDAQKEYRIEVIRTLGEIWSA